MFELKEYPVIISNQTLLKSGPLKSGPYPNNHLPEVAYTTILLGESICIRVYINVSATSLIDNYLFVAQSTEHTKNISTALGNLIRIGETNLIYFDIQLSGKQFNEVYTISVIIDGTTSVIYNNLTLLAICAQTITLATNANDIITLRLIYSLLTVGYYHMIWKSLDPSSIEAILGNNKFDINKISVRYIDDYHYNLIIKDSGERVIEIAGNQETEKKSGYASKVFGALQAVFTENFDFNIIFSLSRDKVEAAGGTANLIAQYESAQLGIPRTNCPITEIKYDPSWDEYNFTATINDITIQDLNKEYSIYFLTNTMPPNDFIMRYSASLLANMTEIIYSSNKVNERNHYKAVMGYFNTAQQYLHEKNIVKI